MTAGVTAPSSLQPLRFLVAVAVVAVAVVLVGCGGDEGAGQEPNPVYVLPSGLAGDTIGAELDLVVRVYRHTSASETEPVVGVTLRMEAVRNAAFGPPGGDGFAPVYEALTDSSGNVEATLRYGDVAGSAELKFMAAGGGLGAIRQVLPGNGVAVRITPRDTAVLPGTDYALEAAVVDRAGNATGETVIAVSQDPAVATVDGGTLHAAGYGRAAIVAARDGTADTAFVSVVPDQKLVAVNGGVGGPALVTFDADGSALTLLAPLGTRSDGVAHPAWHPQNGWVVFERPFGDGRVLDAASLGAERGHQVDPETFDYATWGRWAEDGDSLYFAGRYGPTYPVQVWRVAFGETAATLVGPASPAPGIGAPDPEPGGARIVFHDEDGIGVVDENTGATPRLTGSGSVPRWSPDGATIAFADSGAVWLMGPDGSARRRLTSGSPALDGMISWSWDGAWIATHSADLGTLVLVSAARGTVIPLPFARDYTQPAFAPPNVGP